MQLKTPEIEIPEGNPFQNCKLDRKTCADTLTNLVQKVPGPLVISLNGGWGTGKTTFLKMWKQSLEDNGTKTVYFSAWEDDYCDDALIALIGQIWKHLRDSDYKEITQSLKECVIPVGRKTVFNAVRSVTAGIIDLDEKQLKSISEKAVDEYIFAGKKLKDLKVRLTKLAEKLVKNTGKPLVIIVDELDRCKPLFAIELLEKIKHLFDIKGVVFVLGIDREQLGHSIKSVYGQGMNPEGYLRRFIDMEFVLPDPKKRNYFHHLMQSYGLSDILGERHERMGYEKIFPRLISLFNLSLRDQEHCMRILLNVTSSSKGQEIFEYVLAFLIVLKVIKSEAYIEASKGKYDDPEFLIELILKQPAGERFLTTDSGTMLEAYIIALSSNSELWETQLMDVSNSSVLTGNPVSKRIKTYPKGRAGRLWEILSELRRRFRGNFGREVIIHLSEKIELASLMTRSEY